MHTRNIGEQLLLADFYQGRPTVPFFSINACQQHDSIHKYNKSHFTKLTILNVSKFQDIYKITSQIPFLTCSRYTGITKQAMSKSE